MGKYKEWLQKAKDDLNWTKHNFEGKIYYGTCFTAQQAVEKALKTFLLYHHKHLRKIHDLRVLVDDCISIDKEFAGLKKEAIMISPYYVETRYPDFEMYSTFTEIQAKEAFDVACKIVQFVENKLT